MSRSVLSEKEEERFGFFSNFSGIYLLMPLKIKLYSCIYDHHIAHEKESAVYNFSSVTVTFLTLSSRLLLFIYCISKDFLLGPVDTCT